MKYLAMTLSFVLFGVFSALAQTENKQKEPTSLIELAKQPVCGVRHLAQLEEMVKDQPNNAEFKLQRDFCLKINSDTVFIKVITTLANLNPKFDSYRFLSLYSLLMTDEITQSETYVKNLFAAFPNHWFPYAVQTRYKTAQKDYQGALDSWLKAVDLLPLGDNSTSQSDRGYVLWQTTFDIYRVMKEKDAPDFYERIYNAMHKREENLTVKLKKLKYDSTEYQEARSDIEKVGDIERTVCNYWAKLALKSGNIQLESALLEKMVTAEPRWKGYEQRSAYYQLNGYPKKAFDDRVRSHEIIIESFYEELKQAVTQEQRLKLNNRIANQHFVIGDIYFLDAQYVKAISNYEKAKPLLSDQTVVESKINFALQRLKYSEEKLGKPSAYDPALRP